MIKTGTRAMAVSQMRGGGQPVYKVIIADDELQIRTGLRSIVPWASLGFVVVGCYADGESVLEHMNREPADLLLMDVCMPRFSGLDVVRQARQNGWQCVCVLISGYQEFDFARQAVSLGVTEYLLKPTRLQELKQVLKRVTLELEKMRSRSLREAGEGHRISELIHMLSSQFLNDLYMGVYWEEKAILAQMSRIYGLSEERRVLLTEWRMERNEELAEEELTDALNKLLEESIGTVRAGLANMRGDQLSIALLYADGDKQDAYGHAVKSVMQQAGDLLDITFSLSSQEHFDTVTAFATRKKKTLHAADGALQAELDAESIAHCQESQRLLVGYVCDGEGEKARALMRQLVERLSTLDRGLARSVLIDIVATSQERLRQLHYLPADMTPPRYARLLEGMNPCQWCDEMVRAWMQSLERPGGHSSMIRRVKAYVEEEYANGPSLERAAERAFLNPVYLSRLFKQETGENFTDYLLRVRMRKAKLLLLQPELKIYEVGQLVGYKTVRYFYKAFRGYVGCTPNEWRLHPRERA